MNAAATRPGPARPAERLSPRQRQYAMLGRFVGRRRRHLADLRLHRQPCRDRRRPGVRRATRAVTNIGVMPPGGQVNLVDQWVGTAGRKLAQYENEREEQGRLNKDRPSLRSEDHAALRGPGTAAHLGPASRPPHRPAQARRDPPTSLPPAASLPRPQAFRFARRRDANRHPGDACYRRRWRAAIPTITRITVADRSRTGTGRQSRTPVSMRTRRRAQHFADSCRTVSTFLPVSFTRGTLCWAAGCADRRPVPVQSPPGPDPPFGQLGPAQPLPRRIPRVLRDRGRLRRHQFRARLPAHREPVLRAGRRRHAGSEDPGQRLRRGRQGRHARAPGHQAGQMLANALLAGVVSGIGQGLATSSTEYSTSALGTVASATGAEAYRAGLGTGVGKGAGPAGPVLHQARREHLPGHRGGCRPRSRRGDHQGRAHRRPHDGRRPVFPRLAFPELPKPAIWRPPTMATTEPCAGPRRVLV